MPEPVEYFNVCAWYKLIATSFGGSDFINGFVPDISTVYLFVPAALGAVRVKAVLVCDATCVLGVLPFVLSLST